MRKSDALAEPATDKAVITPGDNMVVLSDGLVKQIKRHFKKDRENRFELFLLSHAIREKYLDQTTGDYSNEFKNFYKQHDLTGVYGSLANFSKYASAGSMIEYVKSNTSNPAKYLNQLPVGTNALYEISLIIKLDQEAFKACWHMTPRRTTKDAKKHEWISSGTNPLITPHVTVNELSSWRKQWEEPEQPKPDEDKYKRNVKLLTLSISEDIFKFDAVGNKVGTVNFGEVMALLEQVQSLLNKDNEPKFRLDSQLAKIQERYSATKEKNDPNKVLSGKSKGSSYKNE